MKNLLFLVIAFIFVFPLFSPRVNALTADPDVCLPPHGIPSMCQDSYTLDNKCNVARIINPEVDCCINKCTNIDNGYDPDAECSGPGDPDCDVTSVLNSLNIFGTKIQYSNEKIPSLVQLGLSAFLAVVSFYALFRGMYLYSIKRTQTTDAAEIGKINKEFGNIIIGFVLAWSAIFIVELVMRILGLPTLTQITLERIDDGSASNVIIIK